MTPILPHAKTYGGSIEEGSGRIRVVVLLASAAAAQSEWVNREVAWWLDNRSHDRLLIVGRSAELRWNGKAGGLGCGREGAPALAASWQRNRG